MDNHIFCIIALRHIILNSTIIALDFGMWLLKNCFLIMHFFSVAVGSTSSNGSSSSPQTSLPPTTSPPPPPSTSSSVQGPHYANVTHTKNTVTRATSHPASASRGNSHSTNNIQTGDYLLHFMFLYLALSNFFKPL